MAVDDLRLSEICARYGVSRLLVFGSVARGTAGPGSDLDLLYELSPGRHLGWEIADLEDELAVLFHRRVDLVSRTSVHEKLRARVLHEAKPLYAA